MIGRTNPIFLPMESQIREFDARILMACCAAARGRTSYLGSTTDINDNLWRFPKGYYFAKAMTRGSRRTFKRALSFGHLIAAWDEEAVVHYPADLYFPRRIDRRALNCVSKLFAWGQDNLDLWLEYPGFPMPLVTLAGNPRADLLRPRLREMFLPDAREIRRRHGDFVLINTNFGSINCELPALNLKYEDPEAPGQFLYGVTARGLPREEADMLFEHRMKLFRSFERMIPAIASLLPEIKFVVRPHFAESIRYWQDQLRDIPNVCVERSGNVIPWLCAAQVMIHNGCTTAVEAYALDVPAIAFEEVRHPRYDVRLPNELSKQCMTHDGTVQAISEIFRGAKPGRSSERDQLFTHYVFQRDELLATDIVLTEIDGLDRAGGELARAARRMVAQFGRFLPEWRVPKDPEKTSHKLMKFPGFDRKQVETTAAVICKLLSIPPPVVAETAAAGVIRVSPQV
ncbi:MAG: surface carbohydrate biosynthesis protein [Aestuariivirga sp.]